MRPLVWKDSYSFRRFFWFYIQRKFTSVRLYQLINRTSPEFQPMHAYGQQSWPLFHRCGSLFLFLNSWRWIVSKSSNEIDHHRSLSKPRENQNTIEKNEFYEWKIWRTIMKTMNENNFICIKINNWFQYDRIPSASLSTIINFNSWSFEQSFRQHSFLSSAPYRPNSNSWPPRDQTEPPPAPIPIIGSYRSIFSTAGLFRSNGSSASTLFYHRPIQANFFNSWPFSIKWGLCQHSFLSPAHTGQILILFSWHNPPKITLYENFWWFSYRRIFSSIFLHELNFEFYFNSFYQWDE